MSKVELSAYERFAEPKEVDVLSILPNKKELGKLFKKDAKAIADALEAMSECERGGPWGVAAAPLCVCMCAGGEGAGRGGRLLLIGVGVWRCRRAQACFLCK